MKKKILAVLLSAAMVAAMAMGCSSGGGSSAKSDGESKGKAEDMTFVVVPKCVHAWFDEVNKGAQKEADLLCGICTRKRCFSRGGTWTYIDFQSRSC